MLWGDSEGKECSRTDMGLIFDISAGKNILKCPSALNIKRKGYKNENRLQFAERMPRIQFCESANEEM